MKRISILFLLIFLLNIFTVKAQDTDITDKVSSSVVRLELFWSNSDSFMAEESNSLGVIISPEGYVLTCYHCISISEETSLSYGLPEGTIADTINIIFNTENKKETIPGKVIAIDEWRDMAVIKPCEKMDLNINIKINTSGFIDRNDLYYASVDPKNPWNSISSGTLAYPVLNDGGREVMGFNMNIKSGSSGSGLFDSSGNLTGLIYGTGSLEKSGEKDMTLAIPGQSVALFLDRNEIPYKLIEEN